MAKDMTERFAFWLGGPARIVADADVRALVDAFVPKWSFRRVTAICRQQFGRDRTPSPTSVWLYWHYMWFCFGEAPPARQSNLKDDREVRAWVEALLPFLTFKQIAQACEILFGSRRAPCASTVANHWHRLYGRRRRRLWRRSGDAGRAAKLDAWLNLGETIDPDDENAITAWAALGAAICARPEGWS